MKLRYLRLIDRYVGVIFCYAFFISRHLFRAFSLYHKPYLNDSPKKILIIKFWGLGSVILAFDFFQIIRKNYPRAYICALTLKQNRPIYEMPEFFDEIIDIDIRKLSRFLLDSIKVVIHLKNLSFDVAFDLEFTSRFSALVTYLINAKRRIGFKYQGIWRGDCFTETVEFKEDTKLRESYLKLSRLIINNADVLPSPVRLIVKDEQQDFVNNLLKKEGLFDIYPIVGVNINASQLCLLRRWPKDYFVVLVKELIRIYSAHVIFIGDKEDLEYVNETIEDIPLKKNIHNFAARTSLLQLVYLLSRLNLFISNDSGPLHLAAYIGIPTVSFFGPETPLIYGPEGASDIVFYRKLDCSPCIRIKNYKHSNCINNHRCLREIKPSEVISEIERKRIL